MSYTKHTLSASSNGRPIKIVATATLGTSIHVVPAGTTSHDEIWIQITNTDSTARKVTIEFGGASDPDDHIVMVIPAESTEIVVGGQVLQNGLSVTAFAAAANVMTAHGYVNRIPH